MASAAPPKRMVSSVFITLSPPYRATVTQQHPVLQAQSTLARDSQHTAVRVSPGDGKPPFRHKKEEPPSSESHSKGWTQREPMTQVSEPQNLKPNKPRPGKSFLKMGEKDQTTAPEVLPPPSDAHPLSFVYEEPAALLSHPLTQTSSSHPLNSAQQPVDLNMLEKSTPSRGSNKEEQSRRIDKKSQETSNDTTDVCGFCRKPVALSEPMIEALNRTYHEGCFQCRSCHITLAGKQYFNKAGIPLCEDCYQASLELCWACGEVITDHVIRALERAYHPPCFTCTTCKQQIGEQAFAQGEVGEVYCLQDYYRKYAPQCSACNRLIIPKEDGTDSFTVECLGQSFHENCYRCEDCGIQLSPEPNDHGCYPLDGKMLCKSCHLNLISCQQ